MQYILKMTETINNNNEITTSTDIKEVDSIDYANCWISQIIIALSKNIELKCAKSLHYKKNEPNDNMLIISEADYIESNNYSKHITWEINEKTYF